MQYRHCCTKLATSILMYVSVHTLYFTHKIPLRHYYITFYPHIFNINITIQHKTVVSSSFVLGLCLYLKLFSSNTTISGKNQHLITKFALLFLFLHKASKQIWKASYKLCFVFSSTLYPAYGRIGVVNLVTILRSPSSVHFFSTQRA